MSRYTIADFVSSTAQTDKGQGFFELENAHTLEVNLNSNHVWTKTGSMVAYTGNIKFSREGMMEHGLGKMLKRAVTGEGTQLTKAEGGGKLYLADEGKKITILNLQNEAIIINGNDLLAFEPTIEWDIKMMRLGAMLAGGLTNVILKGTGMVAFTSHYGPLTLRVSPGNPVMTDPNATVAWSANLEPQIKTDISVKTLLGRGSGESLQLKFEGDSGFVVIQPYEEVPYVPTTSSSGD